MDDFRHWRSLSDHQADRLEIPFRSLLLHHMLVKLRKNLIHIAGYSKQSCEAPLPWRHLKGLVFFNVGESQKLLLPSTCRQRTLQGNIQHHSTSTRVLPYSVVEQLQLDLHSKQLLGTELSKHRQLHLNIWRQLLLCCQLITGML